MSSDMERAEVEFVKLVSKSPCLWSKTHPDFKNQFKKDAVWGVIGKTFGIRADLALGKFRMLRQKYIREKGKIRKAEESGTLQYNRPTWHLLDLLSFLDVVIEPRNRNSVGLRLVEQPETTTEEFQPSTSGIQIKSAVFLPEDDEMSQIFEIKKADPLSLSPPQYSSSAFSTPASSPTPLVYMPSLTQAPKPTNTEREADNDPQPSMVLEPPRKRKFREDLFEKHLIEALKEPITFSAATNDWENVSPRVKHFAVYIAHRLSALPTSKLDKIEAEILDLITDGNKSKK